MTPVRETGHDVDGPIREAGPVPPSDMLEGSVEEVSRSTRSGGAASDQRASVRSLALAIGAVVLLAVVAGPVVLGDLGPTLGGVLARALPAPSVTPAPTAKPSPLETPSPTSRRSEAPRASSPFAAFGAVAGTGKRLDASGAPIVDFTVDAHSSPDGAAGTYHFHHVPTETTFDGQVTCVFVDGERAAVGGWVGTVIRPGTPPKAGDAFLVFLVDGGAAVGASPGIDRASHTYLLPGDGADVDVPADFPTTCPDPSTTAHDEFDLVGDVVVTDG
jgi:hypothetical protein